MAALNERLLWFGSAKLIVLLILCVAPVAFGGTGPRRLALVIGNKDYKRSTWTLANPINDAHGVAAALTAAGFTVNVVTDATLDEMHRAAQTLVESVQDQDVIVFYYSGHGVQFLGQNFLIPIDFTASDEKSARAQAFSVDEFRDRLEKTQSNLRIIILDTCRNNPFHTSRSISDGLAGTRATIGTFIALAAGPDSVASDGGDRQNGIFTYYLIQQMNIPGLELRDIFNRVRRSVYEATATEQLPRVDEGVLGNFYFRAPNGYTEPPRTKASTVPAVRNRDLNDPPILIDAASCDSPPKCEELAKKYFSAGDYKRAAVELTRAINGNPGSAPLLRERAQCYEEIKYYTSAVADLSQAIKLEPGSWRNYWHRSRARDLLGDHDGSLADDRMAKSLRAQGAH